MADQPVQSVIPEPSEPVAESSNSTTAPTSMESPDNFDYQGELSDFLTVLEMQSHMTNPLSVTTYRCNQIARAIIAMRNALAMHQRSLTEVRADRDRHASNLVIAYDALEKRQKDLDKTKTQLAQARADLDKATATLAEVRAVLLDTQRLHLERSQDAQKWYTIAGEWKRKYEQNQNDSSLNNSRSADPSLYPESSPEDHPEDFGFKDDSRSDFTSNPSS